VTSPVEPSPVPATNGTGTDEGAKSHVGAQRLDGQVVSTQTEYKANCSDEDICHRRSKLAREERGRVLRVGGEVS
jgi:hypothetical protein